MIHEEVGEHLDLLQDVYSEDWFVNKFATNLILFRHFQKQLKTTLTQFKSQQPVSD